MSFWDDALPIIGTVGGGIAGSFAGNPMLGASIGGSLGRMGAGMIDSANSPDPNDMAQQRIAMYNQLLGQLPTYQGPAPGQGLTPQDTAAMNTARQQAAGFSQGREGALQQQDAASSGGASRSGKLLASQQQASQAGAQQLSNFDLGEAGIAAQRDAANRQMLNNFNQQNMMTKLSIAGGKSGALQGGQDLGERSQYANSGNQSNLFNGLTGLGMYMMNKNKPGSGGDFWQNTPMGSDMPGGT